MLVVEQRATCRFAENRDWRPITAVTRRNLTTDKRNSFRQFFAGNGVTGFGFESNEMGLVWRSEKWKKETNL
jgi:hypothetical protein